MKTICEDSLQYFPSDSEIKDLHSTFIANGVFNSFLSYTATVMNIATIHAIRKTASMPETLKTLLLSLAVSDVGVGLLVLPFYISLLVGWLQHNSSCSNNEAFHIILFLFSVASFSGVVAVSVDRFLAIHLHLRYQALVTHKRVVAVVISIWVLSVFFSLPLLFVSPDIVYVITIISAVVGLVVITMVYVRIYLEVRRHENQMRALALQVQHSTQTVCSFTSRCSGEETELEIRAGIEPTQTSEMANFASLVKSAFGTFYVYLLFLVCYLPHIIFMAAIKIHGPSISLKRFFLYSMTLVFLNSVLNPVIYCWKMRHMRHAFLNILRDVITWLRSCVTQSDHRASAPSTRLSRA